ncbi:MAG: glycosyltransferase family 4 protein [Phycisphaerae bacterium]|nr:glycosyltransferase family 4 protein [Phycisphaerae bacterium]
MKVLMLGWEFPPFISGGLGTACYGLTKALSDLGTEVLFVLPRAVQSHFSTHVKLMAPTEDCPLGSQAYCLEEFEHVTFRTIDTALQPYQTPAQYVQRRLEAQRRTETILRQQKAEAAAVGAKQTVHREAANTPTPGVVGNPGQYTGDMFQEVERYARLAAQVCQQSSFDVIHAHDWMTYPAGLAVAALTGKPLVVHVHSTEFDRSGEHVNQRIYDIERQGVHEASQVIAVSHLTKSLLCSRYGLAESRINVVYNAIDTNGKRMTDKSFPAIRRDEKIVLFLGRITMQKGPEYFLAAARRVLEVMENVRFIMAGSGDMIRRTVELAAEMGIGHKVLFTGFLRGDDVKKVFQMADVYVMPSVSEPFGIAPLEALSQDVPVIISKQSGVAEVLTHVLKVDFWDINEMANKIIAVLKHPPLQSTLREHGSFEVRKLSWSDSAERCVDIYNKAVAGRQPSMNGSR